MNRRINTVSLHAAGGAAEQPDTYTDRIVKFIPCLLYTSMLAATLAGTSWRPS